jgi:hypothetical protein
MTEPTPDVNENSASRHPDDTHDQVAVPAPRLADELAKAQYEPLLPVEKRLIGYSLGIGLLLLGLMVWASRTLFDVSSH